MRKCTMSETVAYQIGHRDSRIRVRSKNSKRVGYFKGRKKSPSEIPLFTNTYFTKTIFQIRFPKETIRRFT